MGCRGRGRFHQAKSTSNSPTKYRLDTNFYAIVENNPVADEANWELVKCEYLGYWMPTGLPNYVDFAGGDLPQSQVNERLEDTFPNWPIIGIIDMPPFVLNGNETCEDWSACGTEVEVNYSTTTTEGLSGEYSAGAYMETGKKSPVTFDASAGYAGDLKKAPRFPTPRPPGWRPMWMGPSQPYTLPHLSMFTSWNGMI